MVWRPCVRCIGCSAKYRSLPVGKAQGRDAHGPAIAQRAPRLEHGAGGRWVCAVTDGLQGFRGRAPVAPAATGSVWGQLGLQLSRGLQAV